MGDLLTARRHFDRAMTIKNGQGCVAALPEFVAATEADPSMADAWLGRIACGDRDLASLKQLNAHSEWLHRETTRIGRTLAAEVQLGPSIGNHGDRRISGGAGAVVGVDDRGGVCEGRCPVSKPRAIGFVAQLPVASAGSGVPDVRHAAMARRVVDGRRGSAATGDRHAGGDRVDLCAGSPTAGIVRRQHAGIPGGRCQRAAASGDLAAQRGQGVWRG